MKKGNFKVRCISTAGQNHLYTLGKTYEVIDGSLTWDDGENTSQCAYRRFEDIDHLNRWLSATFELIQDIPQYIIINQQSATVTAALKQGKEVVKTAKAKCSPNDTFEFEYGAKLAFERLFEMEVKEVKRPAKVEEWVKIVNAMPESCCGQEYANGDCFKVVSINASGEFDVNVEGVQSFIDGSEYVVLENYNPSETAPIQPTSIDYSTIDYSKLDRVKLFEEIQRRVKLNDSGQ